MLEVILSILKTKPAEVTGIGLNKEDLSDLLGMFGYSTDFLILKYQGI